MGQIFKQISSKKYKRTSNKHISSVLSEMLIKTQWDVSTHPLKWLKFKRLIIPAVGKEVAQLELLYRECKNSAATVSNRLVSLIKWNIQFAYHPAMPPQGVIGRNKSVRLHKNLNSTIHGSPIHHSPKLEITQMYINWWVKKTNCGASRWWNTTQQQKVRDYSSAQEHGWIPKTDSVKEVHNFIY